MPDMWVGAQQMVHVITILNVLLSQIKNWIKKGQMLNQQVPQTLQAVRILLPTTASVTTAAAKPSDVLRHSSRLYKFWPSRSWLQPSGIEIVSCLL